MRERTRAISGRSPRRLERPTAAALAFVLAALAAAGAAWADPCVDDVVAYAPGQNGGFSASPPCERRCLPDVVLGVPYGLGMSAGSLDTLSLGNGGSITVAFTDNTIVDGPGPDFTVFENAFFSQGLGIFTEVATVEASEDGVTFVPFPVGANQSGLAGLTPVHANPETNAIDPRTPEAGGDRFDLATIGLARARFLRITDPGASIDDVGNHFPTPGPGKSGFDLDAVVAINSEATCAACCDADGDGTVRPNDVLLLLRAASELPTAVNLCGAVPCNGRACGDADDDRALTAADVLLCLRLAAALPTPIALCSTGDCDLP